MTWPEHVHVIYSSLLQTAQLVKKKYLHYPLHCIREASTPRGITDKSWSTYLFLAITWLSYIHVFFPSPPTSRHQSLFSLRLNYGAHKQVSLLNNESHFSVLRLNGLTKQTAVSWIITAEAVVTATLLAVCFHLQNAVTHLCLIATCTLMHVAHADMNAISLNADHLALGPTNADCSNLFVLWNSLSGEGRSSLGGRENRLFTTDVKLKDQFRLTLLVDYLPYCNLYTDVVSLHFQLFLT